MKIRIATEQEQQQVFALRMEVFVKEQRVPPEIELDQEDAHALHLMAEENGLTVGCARILHHGKEAHIGRLAVKQTYRGKGIGAALCRFAIDHCRALGCQSIWLNSQRHAVGFYEKLGFSPVGETFWEAGIPHIRMEINDALENARQKREEV